MTNIDNTDPKPALQSTVIWGAVVSLVSGMLSLAASHGLIEQGLANDITGLLAPLGIVIGGVMAIVGRFNPNIRPVSLTGN